jgi:uncharacterized RDD family membrane protein YckC
MGRRRGGKAQGMSLLALTVLAQDGEQAAPDPLAGAGLIIGALVAVVVIAVVLWVLFTRSTRASKGGVEKREEQRRGEPPFESIERGG